MSNFYYSCIPFILFVGIIIFENEMREVDYMKRTLPFILLVVSVVFLFIFFKTHAVPKTSNSTPSNNKSKQYYIPTNDEEDRTHDIIDSGIKMTKRKIGQYTWGFLHSIVGNLPENPTVKQQEQFLNLLHSVAELFPCGTCREDFKKLLETAPKPNENLSRKEWVIWLCDVHNQVSTKLGKKTLVRCDISSLDKRWKWNEETCTNKCKV